MTIKGIFYVLAYVSDLERSKRFYRDQLGWELGTDEYGVAGFTFGSGYVVLHEEDRAAGARAYAGGLHVAVQVDDVDAEHARLKGRGVPVSEPVTEPWGERSFQFSDPDGHVWVYGQADAAEDDE